MDGGTTRGRSDRAMRNLWADGCMFRASVDSDRYGSFTRISAIVYDVRGNRATSVNDYAARQAVADFDCEQEY
jgi:hypothetical protein